MLVKKVKTKANRLEQLKLLNKTLLNEKLDYTVFTRDVEFRSYFLFRIVSLFQDNLKICWYINEYMNQLFDYSTMDNDELFETFRMIIQMSGMSSKNFYYSKYVQNSESDIIKIFSDYLDELNLNYSNQDVMGLYKLYKRNIISEDDLDEVKVRLNLISADEVEKKKKDNKTTSSMPIIKTSSKIDCRNITNSEEIIKLNNKIINYINNRPICHKCNLFNNKKVILDTNVEKPSPVDIIFVGLNPGNEEAIEGRPFIGKSGQHVRNFINSLLENISNFKYVITNSILCSTSNEQEIKSINSVLNNCKPIVSEIIKLFSPAKLIVVFGDKAAKSFGIVDQIKKANGKIYFGNIMPIIHPSAVERMPSNLPLLTEGFKSVIKFIVGEKKIEEIKQEEEIKTEENCEITEDMTLFDIKHVNNKIIYIFFDIKTQEKKYVIKDVKFPVYVKRGDYRNCDYITDSVDAVVEMTEEQRNKLMYSLRMSLQNYVDNSIS